LESDSGSNPHRNGHVGLDGDLGVAAGTVARAYRELEAAGVVTTRRRTGTVVAEGTADVAGEVRDVAARLVDVARAAGLTDEETLAVVRGALLDRTGPAPATASDVALGSAVGR
jgi:GntR family transcriptional regulator